MPSANDTKTTITTLDELRTHYREPSKLVRSKVQTGIDPIAAEFIARSPMAVLSTTDGTRIDASPRGGPPGFVRVLDEAKLAIADLNGNNLLDSLTNIVAHPWAGLLMLMPGRDETLRVNGRASLSIADDILDGFTDELRRPKAAVVIEVDELFMHCGKAFQRAHLWEPETWDRYADTPDGADILGAHFDEIEADEIRPTLRDSYVDDIALD